MEISSWLQQLLETIFYLHTDSSFHWKLVGSSATLTFVAEFRIGNAVYLSSCSLTSPGLNVKIEEMLGWSFETLEWCFEI